MSAAGDAVLARAIALIQRCEHGQQLLRTVLHATDDGLYDPMTDQHSLRLPGGVVRAVRDVLTRT